MTNKSEHKLLTRLRQAMNAAFRHFERSKELPKHVSDNMDEAIGAVVQQLAVTRELDWMRDIETGVVIAVGVLEIDDVLMNRHNLRRSFVKDGMCEEYSRLFSKTQRAYARLNAALSVEKE